MRTAILVFGLIVASGCAGWDVHHKSKTTDCDTVPQCNALPADGFWSATHSEGRGIGPAKQRKCRRNWIRASTNDQRSELRGRASGGDSKAPQRRR